MEPIPARLSATYRGPFRHTITFLSHPVAGTSLLPFLHEGGCGCMPGRRNRTSSLPSHSTRHFRPTVTMQPHGTSSHKMNLSVILVTNTQVFSWRCHGVNVMKASFKMGRVSLDAVFRAHFVCDSLLGSPAAISSLVTTLLVL
jgi:hypothetical protein